MEKGVEDVVWPSAYAQRLVHSSCGESQEKHTRNGARMREWGGAEDVEVGFEFAISRRWRLGWAEGIAGLGDIGSFERCDGDRGIW